MRSDLVDLEARLIHETEKAWLLETENEPSIWIAKSLGEFDGETLTIPKRIAQEKGLI